jgi:hypothetical protein
MVEREIYVATVDNSIRTTLKDTLFIITLFAILCTGYHLFFVEPRMDVLRDEAKIYYIVDMEALTDAKISSMLRERDRTGLERSEEEINTEMNQYIEALRSELLELSKGYPIFTAGVVVNASAGIVDLTPEVAGRLNLGGATAFDQNIKTP